MGKKEKLLEKLLSRPTPKDFKTGDLITLMQKCGCRYFEGGRGSGIGFYHEATKRILQFDAPHPGNELYGYQIKKVIAFLKETHEI